MSAAAGVKLGIMFDAQEDMSWDLWRGHAERIEELGFESLWRSDHLFSLVGFPERTTIETWTSLAYLADNTKRLRFGPLVSPVTFRHPSVLAPAAASVDLLSEGRLEVGLGAGWNTLEHSAFGLELPAVALRYAMLDEYITMLKLIWSGEETAWSGRFYALDGAHGRPRPAQRPHPRIVVGGVGSKLLQVAARHGGEWNAYGLGHASYAVKRDQFFEACEALGRDPDEIDRSVCGPVAIAESEAEVHARVRSLRTVFPLAALFPHGDGPYDMDDLRGRGWFVGQPNEIVEQVERYRSMGVSRVIFHNLDVHDSESIELLGTRVLPEASSTGTTA